MHKIATKKRLTKQKKSEIVSKLHDEILSSKNIILVSCSKLTVAESTQIKKEMVKFGAKFNVYRNTLLGMSLEKSSMAELKKFINGSMSVVICNDEDKIVEVLKFLFDFSKENKKLTLIGGYLFNTIVEESKLKEISEIPNKETLIFRVLSVLAGQINSLYQILNAPSYALLNILEQLKQKQEKK